MHACVPAHVCVVCGRGWGGGVLLAGVYVCVRACVPACMRVCVRACVSVCLLRHASVHFEYLTVCVHLQTKLFFEVIMPKQLKCSV